MRVLLERDASRSRLGQQGLAIIAWDAMHPLIVCLNRATEPDAVLQNDIPKRLHTAFRQIDVHIRFPAQPVRPVSSPPGECRAQISQTLKRKQVWRKRYNHRS